jgi:hypothetical protein
MEFAERGDLNNLLKQQQKPIGKKRILLLFLLKLKFIRLGY